MQLPRKNQWIVQEIAFLQKLKSWTNTALSNCGRILNSFDEIYRIHRIMRHGVKMQYASPDAVNPVKKRAWGIINKGRKSIRLC